VERITTERGGALDSPEERRALDSMTFETWLVQQTGNNTRACATGQVWSHAIMGVDPGEVSALFILDYIRAGLGLMSIRSDLKHGGQHLRIREGTSAFCEGLARLLPPGSLKLNSPVSSISTLPGNRVQLTTSTHGETYLARRVILSVASPIYRTIRFSPSLPTSKKAYVDATKLTGYIKYLPVFSRPFWRENGFCGLGQSFVGPVGVFRDTSLDTDPNNELNSNVQNFALTCFIAGRNARQFVAYSAQEKQERVLHQISRMFNGGRDVSCLLVTVLESRWNDERYNGWGCPIPTLGPGVFHECFDAFVAPAGKLHFIGNETARRWRGYLDGSLESAERGVAEVKAAIGANKASL
jgi:monoamine oxidase